MKLFHLSDLHIERVNEFSMLEDPEIYSGQILKKAAKEHPAGGIILAGDIYDKPVPAWRQRGVQVFDDFLTSLNEMTVRVYDPVETMIPRTCNLWRTADEEKRHLRALYEGRPESEFDG